jgi:hypothetical protein
MTLLKSSYPFLELDQINLVMVSQTEKSLGIGALNSTLYIRLTEDI